MVESKNPVMYKHITLLGLSFLNLLVDPFWIVYQIIILTNDNIILEVKTLTGGNNWMTETYFTACDKGTHDFSQGVRLH